VGFAEADRTVEREVQFPGDLVRQVGGAGEGDGRQDAAGVQAEEEVHGTEPFRDLLLKLLPQAGPRGGQRVGVDRCLKAVQGVDDALAAAARTDDAQAFDDPRREGLYSDGFGHGEAPVG
jgi:hypothetical protein